MESIEQENNLNQLLESSSELSQDEIRSLLKKLSSSEIAHALESSPPKQRKLFFSLLETNEEGDVLVDLGEEIQQELISKPLSVYDICPDVVDTDMTKGLWQNLPKL